MEERVELESLTEAEKACLRRFHAHHTAKEMALELGVTHHAVEKRLKHARRKLGVPTSREAARLLALSEGYDQTVSGPPDLAAPLASAQDRRSYAKMFGGAAMSIVAAATLVLALQAAGEEETYGALESAEVGERTGYRGYRPEDMIQPSEAEMAVITQTTFEYLDENGSGFLEGRESPVSAPSEAQPVFETDEDGNTVDTGEMRLVTPKEATDGFYAQADTDGDGRVSYAEYHEWSRPTLLRIGIPAAWQANLQPSPAS